MSKIRKSARGQECLIRIPGVCNGNPETVVLCHLSSGGMGAKRGNHAGAYGCSSCHDVVDFRVSIDVPKDTIELWHHEAVMRTQEILIQEGLLVLAE